MTAVPLELATAARMVRQINLPRRWIYFIQAGGASGPVKIGLAVDPADRIKTLQQGSPVPLRLISVYWGFDIEECQLHEQFAADRIAGEWFNATPEILSYAAAFAEFHSIELEEMLAS